MNTDTTTPVRLVSDEEPATAGANGNSAAIQELPVADFMESVEYAWTEAGYEARLALKRYCANTHADY